MAEIQDVLDKLDDVIDKIDDVKEKVGEVEIKVNSVIATLALKETIKMVCGRCLGVRTVWVSTPGNPVTNQQIVCPRCNGTGLEVFGEANE